MQESGEMYLETILVLAGTKPRVRAIDIVEYMGFSKPSVSRALSRLRENGFVEIGERNSIKLTAAGLSIAETMFERHQIITDSLIRIGVDRETAERDACRIEHVISEETIEAVKKHLQNRK